MSTVLVVVDSPLNIELAYTIFNGAGYAALKAETPSRRRRWAAYIGIGPRWH